MIYGYLNGQQTMLIINNIPVECQLNLIEKKRLTTLIFYKFVTLYTYF